MGLFQSKEEKQMIALQNFLTGNNSKELVITGKQVISKTASYIDARNKTIENSIKHMNQADAPKSFFGYQEKAKQAIREIEALEKAAPGVTNFKPGAMMKKFEDSLPDCIDGMINRCWESYQLGALKLSKEESKKKKLLSFFETMKIFDKDLYPQNRKLIAKIRKKADL